MALNINKPAAETPAEAPEKVPDTHASQPPKVIAKGSGGELAAILKQILKDKGDKVVVRGNTIPDVQRVATGIFEFDLATGGGFPMGRYTIVYGPESCLDKDTFIQYEVRGQQGYRRNHKGGTIEKLWHRFHGKVMPGKGHYQRDSTEYSEFYAPCVNEEGRVFQNLITDVVDTGVKPCFKIVTESGLEIIATAEHKFFSQGKYVPLSELAEGSDLETHTNVHFKADSPALATYRPEVLVKHHPTATEKLVDGKYLYKRLPKAKVLVEAQLNDLTVAAYIERLNAGNLEGLKFIPQGHHVHHKNENCLDDSPDNLVVLDSAKHGRLHAMERHNNLRYMCVPEKIVSITPVGERHTYDIRMASPYNNYVAAGFVVHNSGKTNITYAAIAEVQRRPGPCNKAVFVDLEGTYDPTWSAQFGVNNEELLVVKPGYGEEAVDLIDALIRADDTAILVVDSLAVLISARELDGSTEKADVGTSAILVKRLVNKLAVVFSLEGRRDHRPCVILLNQTRFKIGVMFGDPECLHADTLVNMVDGRSIPIKEVVDKKLEGPVWAFNDVTLEFESRKILSHHYNGQAKDGEFLTISTQAFDTRNGILSATVSTTHKFLTGDGWKPAKALTLGDSVVTRYKGMINGSLEQFLLGAACGGMHLSTQNKASGGLTTSIRIEDSENPAYAAWKAKKLQPMQFSSTKNDSGSVRYTSAGSYALTLFKERVKGRDPHSFFAAFSWMGLAIWMMDDGHYRALSVGGQYVLSIGRYADNAEMREHILTEFRLLGLVGYWKQDKQIVFDLDSSQLIAQKICKFVPSCMSYKLPEDMGDKYKDFLLNYEERWVPVLAEIRSITPASKRKYRNRQYYDIHVEGLNNYSVGNMDNGMVVHNTIPGGQAMKFNSSLTVRLYGKNKVDTKIHPDLPVFKDTNMVIKKAKVPVRAIKTQYDMAMMATDRLSVGQSASFGAVKNHLQMTGVISKVTGGYSVGGTFYSKVGDIEDHYYSDADFRVKLQAMVMDSLGGTKMLVEADGNAAK